MKSGLQISAQLENIECIQAVGDDFRWYLKLTCSSCGEETQDYVYCSLDESSPLTGGRGEASLVIKCKLCKRENSVDIVRGSVAPYTQEHSGQFSTIVVFDCRGVSPTDFSPRVGWEVKALESGTIFSDIDLKEKEWCDYDEKSGQSFPYKGVIRFDDKLASLQTRHSHSCSVSHFDNHRIAHLTKSKSSTSVLACDKILHALAQSSLGPVVAKY